MWAAAQLQKHKLLMEKGDLINEQEKQLIESADSIDSSRRKNAVSRTLNSPRSPSPPSSPPLSPSVSLLYIVTLPTFPHYL